MKNLALAALALLLSTTASANRLAAVTRPANSQAAWSIPIASVLVSVQPGTRPGLPSLAAGIGRPGEAAVQGPLLYQLEKAGWTPDSFALAPASKIKAAAAAASDAARAELAQFVELAEREIERNEKTYRELDATGIIQARADRQSMTDLAQDLSDLRLRYSAYFTAEGRAELDRVAGRARARQQFMYETVMAKTIALSAPLGVMPGHLNDLLDEKGTLEAALGVINETRERRDGVKPASQPVEVVLRGLDLSDVRLAAYGSRGPSSTAKPAVEEALPASAGSAKPSAPEVPSNLPAFKRVYAIGAALMALLSGVLLSPSLSDALLAMPGGPIPALIVGAGGASGAILTGAYAVKNGTFKARGLMAAVILAALAGGAALGAYSVLVQGLTYALVTALFISGMASRFSVIDRRIGEVILAGLLSALLLAASAAMLFDAAIWPVGAIGTFVALASAGWAVWAYATARPVTRFLSIQLSMLVFMTAIIFGVPNEVALMFGIMTSIGMLFLPERR